MTKAASIWTQKKTYAKTEEEEQRLLELIVLGTCYTRACYADLAKVILKEGDFVYYGNLFSKVSYPTSLDFVREAHKLGLVQTLGFLWSVNHIHDFLVLKERSIRRTLEKTLKKYPLDEVISSAIIYVRDANNDPLSLATTIANGLREYKHPALGDIENLETGVEKMLDRVVSKSRIERMLYTIALEAETMHSGVKLEKIKETIKIINELI